VSPRKPSPDLRDRREREILEAAAAVFAERGLRSARMVDVAERAGIGKSTVYEYFRSKEDLFLRLFDWYTEQAFVSMSRELGASSEPTADALRRSVDSLLESCRRMLPLYPLTLEFWSASTAPEYRERLGSEFRTLYRRFRSVVADALRTGIARGELGPHVDPDAVAAVLVSAYDGLFLQAWFDRDFDPVPAGRRFLDVVIRGMGAVPSGGGPPPEGPGEEVR
jgi:AcrR family transcriptional regulator